MRFAKRVLQVSLKTKTVIMDQMWQICELEESRSVKLTRYERFSVTPVPESWIVYLKDGTCLCFWPNFNAESKIRSLHLPEKEEKCKYYKCRVLLDGGNAFFIFLVFKSLV